jgi:hypothetical protein
MVKQRFVLELPLKGISDTQAYIECKLGCPDMGGNRKIA